MKNYYYEFNGFGIGKDTPYLVEEIQGLDLPDVDYSDADRPNSDGGFGGRPVLRRRTVDLGLKVISEDREELEQLRRALSGAFQHSTEELPFKWQRPGLPEQMIYARVYRAEAPYDYRAAWSHCDVVIQLRSQNPRIFETMLRTATFGMVGLQGGFGFPLTFPFNFSPELTGDTGRVTVQNVGNYHTFPALRVHGPFPNARLINATTGKSLTINQGVAADEFLDIDMDRRSVLLNGQADRRYYVDDRSEWWSLVPGSNDIIFAGAQYDERASLFMEWQSAWTF